MTRHPNTSTASRLLALLLGVFFAIQPAVRAAGCGTKSMLLGLAGRSCCCAAMSGRVVDATNVPSAVLPSCCAERPAAEPAPGPRAVSGSCGCEIHAPVPQDALPRTIGLRSSDAESDRAAAIWIAEGARSSSITIWFPGAGPPGSGSDPSPLVGCKAASCEKSLSCPDVVARSCDRGVNGLLAVLGVVRL